MLNYTITLEVLTPVYIGNGNSISKKDFEIKGNRANIYDPIKLYSIFGNRYEEFLMNPYSLTDYLSRNKANNIEKALKYSVYCGNSNIRKSDGIMEFIKDPYGCPYIPGSSLKGVLRTAILSYKIREKNSYEYKKDPISRGANRIEKELLGDTSNSLFRHIRISDSMPLSADDLILCKKTDVFKNGSPKSLNICREALKTGTEIKFHMTIDETDNVSQKKMLQADYIMNSIREFTRQYQDNYLRKFSTYDGVKYGEEIIYLGGGTGFLTKTVNHAIYGNEALKNIAYYLDGRFKRHNHKKDIALGVSPRAMKCTIVNHKTIEMGICRIRIEQNETV